VLKDNPISNKQLGVKKMSENKRPTTIGIVIFWWIAAVGLILYDFLILLPGGNLNWWQIAISAFVVVSAIHTTITYLKEQRR